MYIAGFGNMSNERRFTPIIYTRGVKARYLVITGLACLAIGVLIGTYYNASRQTEALIRNQVWGAALPPDNSVIRDLGYISPVSDRLEVGML